MEERLKAKLKIFLGAIFELVNNIPQEEERKRILLDLVDRLVPMNIIHQVRDVPAFSGAGAQPWDGIIVDHITFKFKLEESRKYAFKVIDSISPGERKQLLAGIREVVWDFHNLVKTMIEPVIGEENEEALPPHTFKESIQKTL
ncbi:hypothetical protein E3J84_01325 [Candidatus Aerophobetes bacterium]|uniref:Uncharacterized protein n=1 Tax=Aerophobetes bacterium TaxID=2030807 RepID=A0A523S3H1_UNCAE|nr:MAG: hypothetical protein E3J84_01325 [Candidatus Aerophobetes bacterium]